MTTQGKSLVLYFNISDFIETSQTHITSQFGKLIPNQKVKEKYSEHLDLISKMVKCSKQLNQEFENLKKEFSTSKVKIWHDIKHELKKTNI